MARLHITYNAGLTRRVREDLRNKDFGIARSLVSSWEKGDDLPTAHELIGFYHYCSQHYDMSQGVPHLPFWIMEDGFIEVPLNPDHSGVDFIDDMANMRYNFGATKYLVEKTHLSKDDVRKFIGVTHNKVTSWEKGRRIPDAHQLGYIYQLYRHCFNIFSLADLPLSAPLGLHGDKEIDFLLRRDGN